MANDIYQDFLIHAPAADVFRGIATPEGLDTWWTKRSTKHGDEFVLDFGPGYEWRARIVKSVPDREFELELTRADEDWTGTRVGFVLEGDTQVRFSHTGWPRSNEHYRTSCYCWAMYLRLLKRYIERGEVVPYDLRLEA